MMHRSEDESVHDKAEVVPAMNGAPVSNPPATLPPSSSQLLSSSPSRPKTSVTHRTDRSWRMRALQTSVKPLGSWLMKPKPPVDPGDAPSPILRAPEDVSNHCNVRQVLIGSTGIRMYEINDRSSLTTREHFIPAQIYDLKNERVIRRVASRQEPNAALTQVQTHESEKIKSRDFANSNGSRRRKHIYYFAGGSWQSPPAPEHWKLCAHLVHSLTDQGHPTTVSLVSYPLAPDYPADAALKYLERWYYEILPTTPPSSIKESWPNPRPNSCKTQEHNHVEQDLSLSRTKTKRLVIDEEVIFAGDSSGGNIALALPMMVLDHNPAARTPDQLLLISPAVDLRNSNPEISSVDKVDPILGLKVAESSARAWTGQSRNDRDSRPPGQVAKRVDPEDPRVSPLLGNVAILEHKGVLVHGIIAGYDVLAPDARLLRQRLEKEGVAGSWLEWDKQMHCFPLAFSHTKFLPESKEAVDWIIQTFMQDHSHM